jgi:hypothetical protein
MKTVSRSFAIASLLTCCGAAVAQPVVDGTLDASYGAAQWVNTDNPTQFGDNAPTSPGNPIAVTTGFEWRIPLASIGNPGVGSSIRFLVFINGQGHDFASNQFLPSLPAGSGNLGEPRNINLANIAGNQFASVTVPAS